MTHYYTDNVMDTAFFIVCKIYLSFSFIEALDSKEYFKIALGKGIMSAMECADLAAFTFDT